MASLLPVSRIQLSRALPSLRPVSARTRPRLPSADRYLAIHAFFTREAHLAARPPKTLVRTQLRLLQRSNTTNSHDSSESCEKCTAPAAPKPTEIVDRGHAQDYTPFIRRLIGRTQHLTHDSPHRPTKEELLGAARNRWERFRVRLQWFFIRGWRRFNTDDLSAFASWFVLGNSE